MLAKKNELFGWVGVGEGAGGGGFSGLSLSDIIWDWKEILVW